MNPAMLLNPQGQLPSTIASRLRQARKNKPIWVRRVAEAGEIQTLEGRLRVQPGDHVCRGIAGEQWPQEETKLLQKYLPSDQFDADGWQRFDPKTNSEAVEAVQVDFPFQVISHWGQLSGKSGDYVLRSKLDATDVWIVDKAIFEASYEFLDTAAQHLTLNSDSNLSRSSDKGDTR